MNRQSARVCVHAFLVFTFSVVACYAAVPSSFILVSDVDDTVKISHVLDRDDALRRAATELVFAGMPELYGQMLAGDSSPEHLRFISGNIFEHKVRETLTDSGFPPYKLTIRDLSNAAGSVSEYKSKQMRQLYGMSQDSFILIGDDTESDPEVYSMFATSKNKGQVLAIYIRRVTGRAVPADCIPFVTAFDVATHEYLSGRLSLDRALVVGNAVYNSEDRTFLPDFQVCSTTLSTPTLPDQLAKLQAKIDHRVAEVCSRRKIDK